MTSGLICLVGATGTGKTAAALGLAERFPITVINADSRQVYSDLPIITAQPSLAEQGQCPHRLYGFLGLDETISAGEFARIARPALEECTCHGRIPVLVGGTGLYLHSLGGGLAPIPQIPKEVRMDVLRRCVEFGPQKLHAELRQVDPATAARVHPRDKQRISRALEVFVATGRTMSWWHAQGPGRDNPPLRVIGLRKDRADLHERLACRIESMLKAGALEEIERAWAGCPDPLAPAYSGIGCRELLDHLAGRTSLEQARDSWLFRTRGYARRQETWFKNIAGVEWVESGEMGRLVETFRSWVQ